MKYHVCYLQLRVFLYRVGGIRVLPQLAEKFSKLRLIIDCFMYFSFNKTAIR